MFLCSFPKLLGIRWSEVLKNLDFAFLNKPVTLFWSILYVDMLAPTVKGQLLFLSCHFLCHRYSLDPRPNLITSICWEQLKMTSRVMGSCSFKLVRYFHLLKIYGCNLPIYNKWLGQDLGSKVKSHYIIEHNVSIIQLPGIIIITFPGIAQFTQA